VAAEFAGDWPALDKFAHGGRSVEPGRPTIGKVLMRLRGVDAPEAPAGAVEADRISIYRWLRCSRAIIVRSTSAVLREPGMLVRGQ
jgi:hypothetical protein